MATPGDSRPVSITPVPTEEEAAAIAAAIAHTWHPRPAPSNSVADDESSRWRFSGRWWSKPVPTRRSRP